LLHLNVLAYTQYADDYYQSKPKVIESDKFIDGLLSDTNEICETNAANVLEKVECNEEEVETLKFIFTDLIR
jgi:hypothetical protein